MGVDITSQFVNGKGAGYSKRVQTLKSSNQSLSSRGGRSRLRIGIVLLFAVIIINGLAYMYYNGDAGSVSSMQVSIAPEPARDLQWYQNHMGHGGTGAFMWGEDHDMFIIGHGQWDMGGAIVVRLPTRWASMAAGEKQAWKLLVYENIYNRVVYGTGE